MGSVRSSLVAARSEARSRHERASASESWVRCGRVSWRPAAKRGAGMSDLTYPHIGATRDDGPLPGGYRHVMRRERLGDGRDVFDRATAALRSWDMQRGAGLRVPES